MLRETVLLSKEKEVLLMATTAQKYTFYRRASTEILKIPYLATSGFPATLYAKRRFFLRFRRVVTQARSPFLSRAIFRIESPDFFIN